MVCLPMYSLTEINVCIWCDINQFKCCIVPLSLFPLPLSWQKCTWHQDCSSVHVVVYSFCVCMISVCMISCFYANPKSVHVCHFITIMTIFSPFPSYLTLCLFTALSLECMNIHHHRIHHFCSQAQVLYKCFLKNIHILMKSNMICLNAFVKLCIWNFVFESLHFKLCTWIFAFEALHLKLCILNFVF